MAYLFLALAVGLFVLAIKGFGIVPRVKGIVSDIHAATAVMKSRELSDEQKENAIQKAAVGMFSSLFSITARVLLTFAVPGAFVMLGSVGGLYSTDDAVRAATDWYFITASTVLMIGAFVVVK